MDDGASRERTLRALSTLRERDQAQAEAELRRARQAELRARQQAEDAREALRALCRRTRQALAPSQASASAFALQQAARFRTGQGLRETALRAALARAEQAEATAAQAVHRARQAVAQSHARAQVVERRRDGEPERPA